MKLFERFKKNKTDNPSEKIISDKDDVRLSEGKYGVGVNPDIPFLLSDELTTPERIQNLGRREIFVFGSNLAGRHGGGAAAMAMRQFGAVYGQGVGLQGNSYAIPTMQGGVETIRPYVDEFIRFAKDHKGLRFFVTRIGCGIAGFNDEDIAPLFIEAFYESNIILPQEFLEVLSNDHLDDGQMTHAYGITRTLVDVLIYNNELYHFSSPAEAIESVQGYFDRFIKNGDEIAFTAIRVLMHVLHNEALFSSKGLDTERLRQSMFDFKNFKTKADIAYFNNCKERIVNLIIFMNKFRRYGNNPCHIYRDIQMAGLTDFSHCSPNKRDYYFSIPRYPMYFFCRTLMDKWNMFAPNGKLDEKLLKEYMLEQHDRSVRELGMDAVIQRDYVSDGPCHPEVYFPKQIGSGPVYVRHENGRFTRSCGEGKGPRRIPYEIESYVVASLLKQDSNYTHKGNYYVPVNDMTLPVIERLGEVVEFKSFSDKIDFIRKWLNTPC